MSHCSKEHLIIGQESVVTRTTLMDNYFQQSWHDLSERMWQVCDSAQVNRAALWRRGVRELRQCNAGSELANACLEAAPLGEIRPHLLNC